ncbi:MAG: hypothetical protein AMJ94_17055 [Deltaproteobacteria bacterium SM23_61]|nr:MAG: hypothetical protein AMJ94_17055 [Deltaproteobacteria bacterium SM23_61]
MSGIARPGSKGIARKNHEARFITWAGRAKGRPAGRPWARLILRKPGFLSLGKTSPADAFSGQCPCSRATSLFLGRLKNRKSKGRIWLFAPGKSLL